MSEAGGSFLTSAAETAAPAAGAVNGTPAGAQGTVADGAQQAVADAMNAPPEGVPAKFWDAEKKTVRTEEMVKGYINLEKLLSREKVPVPVDENDEDGWNRWYAATGRPESPDKYEFKQPELPADLPYDKDAEQNFRTWAHVNGLNKKQATNLYDGYVKNQIERHASWHTTMKQQRAELEASLQREYGTKLESVKQTAGLVVREHADAEFKGYLDETGLGNDPRMVRFLAKVGAKMTGETKLKGTVQAAPEHQDYKSAIADFREKHKEALFSKEHPNHELRVKEYNKLFEGAYGNEPANRY